MQRLNILFIAGFLFLTCLVSTAGAAENDYLAIWKELVCEQNSLGEEDFAKKIQVMSHKLEVYPNMQELRVKFRQKIGWLEIEGQHIFTVKLSSAEGGYKHLPLPRDTWFSKDDIKLAIKKKLFNSTPLQLSAATAPAFTSLAAAKEHIKSKTGITEFIKCEKVFYVPGKVPRIDGDPYLVFTGHKKSAGSAPTPNKPQSHDNIRYEKAPARPSLVPAKPLQNQEIRHYERAPDKPSFAPGNPALAAGGGDEVIKGWLNLIDGKINFWDDSMINY